MTQTLYSANPAEKSGSDLDGAADTARRMEQYQEASSSSQRIYGVLNAIIRDCVRLCNKQAEPISGGEPKPKPSQQLVVSQAAGVLRECLDLRGFCPIQSKGARIVSGEDENKRRCLANARKLVRANTLILVVVAEIRSCIQNQRRC